MKRYFFILSLSLTSIFSFNSYAILNATNISKREKEDTIIKADKVKGNRDTNTVTATGNVEVKNGQTTAKSNKMSYDQNNGLINLNGDVSIKDIELGNIYTQKAQIKDDFTQGQFPDSTIVFFDGSYLQSKKTKRKDENTIILTKPLFSICPNDEIASNNKKAGHLLDQISIKSSKTTIDQKDQRIRSSNARVRIYNFPVFYTPYLSLPMKSAKRKSGFLTPSYVNNTRFGLGAKIPYFIAAQPNTDITITPTLYQGGQVILNNEVDQLVKYGRHNISVDVANNKITSDTDRQVIKRTDKEYRYKLRANGEYVFTKNSSLTHRIFTVGDRNYLRDYDFDFRAYTTSQIDYSYNKGRDYFGINTVKFQELEEGKQYKAAQIVLPSINYHTESKKPVFYKERYILDTNFTHLTRESGLQYRRLTATPEINVPFNLRGNLIDLNTKIQWDYYSLEENYRFQETTNLNYDKSQSNYKPEFSATWRLPLIQKLESNTFMLEPMASFVSSSVKKNQNDVPNEDSNNSELTINNLFVDDRIAGYDRNETGKRVNYGLRSSMYNRLGQFELSLGQSYRINQETQDVTIRGFNDNDKSNIVGQFSYIWPKYFYSTYLFQLNESDYDNEVNSLLTRLTLSKLTLQNNYLLIKSGIINPEKREQNTLTVSYKFTPRFKAKASIQKDLASNRDLHRSLGFDYGGCCVIFRFVTTETDTNNLTKKQRSHSINIVVKGL